MRQLLRGMLAIDVRSLALFRMALGTILICDLTQRLWLWRDFYGQAGIYPVELARAHTPAPWSGYFLGSGEPSQLLALTATLGLACLLLLGWRTTWTTVGLLVMVFSLHARAPLALDVGDNALRYLLFWLALLPSGAVWSLDARREGPREGSVNSLASAGILVQMAGVYVFAGLSKLRSPHWLSGNAVAEALAGDTWCGPLGHLFYSWPSLLIGLTYATILVEAVVPYGLFAPWPFRLFSLVALWGFNLALGSSIQLGFIPWALSAGLLLFVPFRPTGWLLAQPLGTQALALLAWPVMLGTSLHSVLTAEPLPAGLTRALSPLMAEQSWTMYMTPYPENFRLRVEFETPRGRRVVGLGARRPGWPSLQAWDACEGLWNNYRCRMYLYDNIAHESRAREWRTFVDWFERRWNSEHSPEDRVRGRIFVVKERRRPWKPGEDLSREQLLEQLVRLYGSDQP